MSAYSVLIGAVLLVPLAVAEPVRRPITDISPLVWLALAYLVLISCCLSYLWWNEGVRTIGAGRAASFTFLVPVAAMISAIPILGEWPDLVQLVGGGLIVSGLFIANRS
jgi:drug/metabolite transporter (DMT)-like permease